MKCELCGASSPWHHFWCVIEQVDCETCDGHGSVGYEVCTDCFGKGYEEWQEGVRIG